MPFTLDIEARYDLGAVQVSTDGGQTYASIAGSHTTASHAHDADPRVVGQLPGLAGESSTYTKQTYDLKKYAARFNEDHPDIEIKWVRDSTG